MDELNMRSLDMRSTMTIGISRLIPASLSLSGPTSGLRTRKGTPWNSFSTWQFEEIWTLLCSKLLASPNDRRVEWVSFLSGLELSLGMPGKLLNMASPIWYTALKVSQRMVNGLSSTKSMFNRTHTIWKPILRNKGSDKFAWITSSSFPFPSSYWSLAVSCSFQLGSWSSPTLCHLNSSVMRSEIRDFCNWKKSSKMRLRSSFTSSRTIWPSSSTVSRSKNKTNQNSKRSRAWLRKIRFCRQTY